MNLRKSLMIAALPVLFLTACKQTDSAAPETAATSENTTAAVAAKPETANFKIDGMVCAVGCAKTIEKKLASLEGVTKASVDYDKKEATVEFDAAKQSPEKLVETVEKVGDGKTYKVSNLKSSGDHASVFVSHEDEKEKAAKDKDKKKSKKDKKASDKKDGEAKGGCCAAKKSCHSA
ncbi:heavy metal-associated domain-containing protein [Flavobacterium sp.]|uniref:heavy-metal-associated domain-containing protein n=1 Tax=Flavobacterium sp. TaxID=239 RepID=UPI00122460C2|nr:heavy metal-associated domain-containing protein [Flavobacterium sp.]RZJ73898.1 MAG: heavy-metal-associated domain-containing protein [Flavobacterium sp.]